MKQRVAEQPGQRGHRPPVGVVDQEKQPSGAVRAQILAAGRRQDTARALDRCGHRPTELSHLGRELVRHPRLALPAGPVQPPDGPASPLGAPLAQLPQFLLAAGEPDHGKPGVEHPARLLAQPLVVERGWRPPPLQHVKRRAVPEDVDIGADHPVREPASGSHILGTQARSLRS